MTIRAIVLGTFILLCNVGYTQAKLSKVEVNGYIKNLQSLYYLNSTSSYLADNLFHNRINLKWTPSNTFRFQMSLRNRLFLGDTPRFNPNYGKLIDESNKLSWDLSANLIDQNGILLNSNIDRIYAELYLGNVEVKIGRQRINWGITKFWNPNDLFNTYNFIDFDYEERPGSDAVLIQYNTGVVSSISVVSQYFDRWEQSVFGGLWKFNVRSFDMQILAAKAKSDLVLGAGLSGVIKAVSIEAEISYFHPIISKPNTTPTTSFVVGADYIFSNSVFWSTGYLFTQSGQTSGGLESLLLFDISARQLYPFRHALFTSFSFPVNPLLNVNTTWVYSPASTHPVFHTATITYSLSQNWDLSMVTQLFMQYESKSFSVPITGAFLLVKYNY